MSAIAKASEDRHKTGRENKERVEQEKANPQQQRLFVRQAPGFQAHERQPARQKQRREQGSRQGQLHKERAELLDALSKRQTWARRQFDLHVPIGNRVEVAPGQHGFVALPRPVARSARAPTSGILISCAPRIVTRRSKSFMR